MPTGKAKRRKVTHVACGVCLQPYPRKGIGAHYARMHPEIEYPGVKALDFGKVARSPRLIDAETGKAVETAVAAARNEIANETAKILSLEKKEAKVEKKEEAIRDSLAGMYGAIATIQPKTFTISSALIFQAKHICEHEWGWAEMEPGQWLDIFLYRMMLEHGFAVGGYVRVNPDGSTSLPSGIRAPGDGDDEPETEPEIEDGFNEALEGRELIAAGIGDEGHDDGR